MNFHRMLEKLEGQEVEQPVNKRIGGYYLRQWYKLQKNINNLNSLELVEAKILFSALAEMEEEERSWLAAKYYTPLRVVNNTSTRISDAEVAEQLGISVDVYKRKRNAYERKIGVYVEKHQATFNEDREKAIMQVYGK